MSTPSRKHSSPQISHKGMTSIFKPSLASTGMYAELSVITITFPSLILTSSGKNEFERSTPSVKFHCRTINTLCQISQSIWSLNKVPCALENMRKEFYGLRGFDRMTLTYGTRDSPRLILPSLTQLSGNLLLRHKQVHSEDHCGKPNHSLERKRNGFDSSYAARIHDPRYQQLPKDDRR